MSKHNLLTLAGRLLAALPTGLFTIMVTGAILWLTLAPDPLPDNDMPAIPGLDKVAHACMFGGFYFAAAFDFTSRRRCGASQSTPAKWLSATATITIATVATAFGGGIELLQGAMAMGRGCDIYDFIADAAGVLAAVALTPAVLKALYAK